MGSWPPTSLHPRLSIRSANPPMPLHTRALCVKPSCTDRIFEEKPPNTGSGLIRAATRCNRNGPKNNRREAPHAHRRPRISRHSYDRPAAPLSTPPSRSVMAGHHNRSAPWPASPVAEKRCHLQAHGRCRRQLPLQVVRSPTSSATNKTREGTALGEAGEGKSPPPPSPSQALPEVITGSGEGEGAGRRRSRPI